LHLWEWPSVRRIENRNCTEKIEKVIFVIKKQHGCTKNLTKIFNVAAKKYTNGKVKTLPWP